MFQLWKELHHKGDFIERNEVSSSDVVTVNMSSFTMMCVSFPPIVVVVKFVLSDDELK